MAGRGHVRYEKVDQSIVVYVAQIGPHRRERSMGQVLSRRVGKGAVPVILVKLIRDAVIVGHIKVRPAVVIIVPPRRGVAPGFTLDARAFGDVGEGAVAVVVKQVTAPPLWTGGLAQQVGRDINV